MPPFAYFLPLPENYRKEVVRLILSYSRSVILYTLLILVIRLMGKRQIGQMEPTELVVTMLVADLASIPMQDGGIPLLSGIIPIITVLGMELILSTLALRSVGLRRFLCGKPVILIENGKILQHNLRRTRITLDELIGHLREKDILNPEKVQFAILETNGNLSVFPFPKELPASAKDAGIPVKPQRLPITIISDGKILHSNMQLAKKDPGWLQRVLREKDTVPEKVWLLTVDSGDRILLLEKEE